MTPLPKRRLSHKRQGKRRASFKVVGLALSVCKNCQKPVEPHRVCRNCGFYNGKAVKVVATV
ncbi:50S ribosomal protein L32 [Candidatus Microgenomates bacterium]|nr:50S ribosomal protein L32 [Candidatus Microgenomates bacterium]